MTKPKFANTTTSSSRRPKREEGFNEYVTNTDEPRSDSNEHTITLQEKSIDDFMETQKNAMRREPTRPITLRFEESMWQKVEALRGPLSKNDFFKYLVRFYASQKNQTQN